MKQQRSKDGFQKTYLIRVGKDIAEKIEKIRKEKNESYNTIINTLLTHLLKIPSSRLK